MVVVRCGSSARLLSSVSDDAIIASLLWVYATGSYHSAPAADHQTSQCLFHSVMLDGIDERVHADVQVGQGHCGVETVALITQMDKDKEYMYWEPADDDCSADDYHRLDDVPLDSFGFHLRCVRLC